LAQNSACQPTFDAILDLLDPGERAAILLAQELNADLLLLDDMKARRTATQRGFAITGILGILDQAATMKLLDLPAAVQNLQSNPSGHPTVCFKRCWISTAKRSYSNYDILALYLSIS
jgi:hypothetical protein